MSQRSDRHGLANSQQNAGRFRCDLSAGGNAHSALNILDHLADPVVTFDKQWRYTFVNARACQVLGKTSGELIGNSMCELFPEDMDAGFLDACNRAWATGEPCRHERYSRILDAWVEAYVCPLEDGAVAQWREITDRRAAADALRASEEKYRNLFDNIVESVTVYEVERDGRGRIGECRLREANPSFLRELGVSSVEAVRGRTSSEIFGNGWSESHLTAVQQAMDTGQAQVREVYRPESDQHYLTSVVRLNPDTYLGTGWDITAIKRAEQALRESEERFRVLTENLHSAVALVDEAGVIRIVNSSFRRMFDLPPGADLLNINSRDWAQWQVLDESGLLLDVDEHPVRKALLSGTAVRDQLVAVRSPYSPDLKWLLISADLVLDGQGKPNLICTYYDITPHKRAEEALRQSLERLERVLEVQTVGVMFWDLDTGCMVDANDTFLHMMGYSRSEVEARQLTWQALTPPEYMDVSRAEIEKFMATGRIGPYEKEYYRRDGTRHWLLFAGSSLGNNQCVEFCIDISDRKKAEDALRQSELRYRMLHETLRDPFVHASMDGGIIECNDLYCEMLGYTPDEIRALTYQQITPERWHDLEQGIVREQIMARGYSDVYQKEYRRKDGTVFPVELRTILSRGGEGQPASMWAIVRDITERRREEERLRQTQKLESVGLLAGGIAHDFNNLLTGVMGNASLLLEDAAPERAELLRSIIASTERAAHLTRQLLAYSGKGQFIVRDLDVTQAVNEMADLVQFSIPKSVSLALNLERRLPFVAMDPGQLQQILMNLVINAGEAIGDSNPGRITVTTSMADVQAPFTDELGDEVAPGRYVCVEVRDTGSGIDPEKKAKIFDPFFTTKFVGRGLGLAAIAGVLRSQKGGIIVESALGKGSTFKVFLPVAGRGGPAVQEPGGKDGRPAILVVDDEVAVRDFIGAVLRKKGYQVVQASDGREALAVCGSAPGAIGAAIVDIIMPNMAANELLPALIAKQPGLKILLTSGYSEAEARRLCAAYPDAAFIQKPYTAQQLAKTVEELVGAIGH